MASISCLRKASASHGQLEEVKTVRTDALNVISGPPVCEHMAEREKRAFSSIPKLQYTG